MSTTPAEFLDTYLSAVNAADPAALTALYSPRPRVFDAMSAWQYRGHQWRSQIDRWMGEVAAGGESTADEVEAIEDGDLAVVHSTVTYAGPLVEGPVVSMSVRLTLVLARDGEGWRIVHEHSSLPVTCDEEQRAIHRHER